MNTSIASYDRIISLYEDFGCVPVRFDPMENPDRISYAAPSSLHSPVTREYYGQAVTMDAIRLTEGARAKGRVRINNTGGRRFLLKVRCMLENWREFANHISIEVNGTKIYEHDSEFFENVNLGWPSVYYPVPRSVINEDENTVTVSTNNATGAGLLIGEAAFISLPAFSAPEQLSCLRSVRLGERFTVAVYTGCEALVRDTACEGVSYAGAESSPIDEGVVHLHFTADMPGKPECTVFFDGLDGSLRLWLPEVTAGREEMCRVGTDSDDHRHDFSEEAERIMRVFAYTGMGNYFQFRPNLGRNYFEFPPEEVWKKRFKFLEEFNTYISLKEKENKKVMPFTAGLAREKYAGLHIHEPYLFFCPMLENSSINNEFVISGKIIRSCKSFEESEKLYRSFLSQLYSDRKSRYGSISVGCPSFLCIYEAADPNIDRIIAEPVSNCNILYGAVRGVSNTEGKVWGCHIPPDWYFGLPSDDCKARKLRLAMNLAYIQGADFIYPENSLFKTNAFMREDWESRYTSLTRQYLRDMYDYAVRNPRSGRPVVDKAVIYGRFDNFYWRLDDRMAELADTGDWDRVMWGKWEDDSSRWCWSAVDAWLPAAAKQNSCEHVCNKKLFSGTPYGDTDIIPWWGDFSKYKTLALLGWNSMDRKLFDRLRSFVASGGTLFISWCHFNTAGSVDAVPEMLDCREVEEFIGAKPGAGARQSFKAVFDDGFTTLCGERGVETAEFIPTTALPICRDEKGELLYLVNRYGKGTVYFGAFKGYFAEKWAVDSARHVMGLMGRSGDIRCSNPSIAFTRRKRSDGRYSVDILNTNCAVENGVEEFELYLEGITVSGCAGEGRITTLVL